MFGQMVTLYHKSYDGDKTKWARHELTGVQLSLADGTTISASGELVQGGSTLVIRKRADAERIRNGDYIVSGSCSVEAFEGNPVKVLAGYAPMRVSGRKMYPYRSALAHATYTLEGSWK